MQSFPSDIDWRGIHTEDLRHPIRNEVAEPRGAGRTTLSACV